jgi:hypothetical protein
LRPVLQKHPRSDELGSFINSQYLESVPSREKGFFPSLESWLEDEVGILRSPRLNDPNDPSKLSKMFSYIVENHPKRLLGTLKAHWSIYEDTINDDLTETLSEVDIPCTNVGSRKLKQTFLPLKELEKRCSEFLEPQNFPFLTLDDDTRIEEWKFLEILGVGVKSDLDFYLEILRRYKENSATFSYKIYEEIQKKIWASEEPTGLIDQVQYDHVGPLNFGFYLSN